MPHRVVDKIKASHYDKLLEDGNIKILKYLRLEGYPVYNGVFGFQGWDRNKVGNRYRVYLDGNDYLSTWYAQYIGEVYIRFATVRSGWNSMPGGRNARRYIISHYGEGREHLINMVPHGGLLGRVDEHLRRLNDANIHEYVFRIWRDEFGAQDYHMDVYFHDVDLPKIPDNCLDDNKIVIVNEFTGNDEDFLRIPESPDIGGATQKLINSPRVLSVAEMLKEKWIPMLDKRPELDDYQSWFSKYADLNMKEGRKLYEFRSYLRLP